MIRGEKMKHYTVRSVQKIMRDSDEILDSIEKNYLSNKRTNIATALNSSSTNTRREARKAKARFKREIEAYMRKHGVNKVNKLSPLYYLKLEDENFHLLNEILEKLEFVKMPTLKDRKKFEER